MNANPSSSIVAVGDFELPPHFSIETMQAFIPSVSGSLDLTEKGGRVVAGWTQSPNADSRLSRSVFSNMIEQAQFDVQKLPGKAAPLVNLALAFLAALDFERASEILEQVLALDSENYVAILNLVKIKVQQGKTAEAELLCRQGLEEFPHDPSLTVNLSVIIESLGNQSLAREILEQTASVHPTDLSLQYALGMTYIAQGEFRKALSSLRRVSKGMERAPQVHQALGVAYALVGQAKEATRSFQLSLSLDKNTAGSIRGLAQVFASLSQFDRVAQLLGPYVEASDDEQASNLLAHAMLKLNRVSEARQILERVLTKVRKDRPDDRLLISQLLNDIGWCFQMQGNTDRSDRLFREAIEVSETRGSLPFVNLAVQLHKEKSDIEARSLLQRAIKLFPNQPNLYLVLANLEEQTKNQSEALRLAEQAVVFADAPAEAYAYLGWLLSDWFGDLEGARLVLERGTSKFPKSVVNANNLAYVYLLAGEIEKASEVLSKFQAEDKDVHLCATHGLLALKRGNLDKARQLYFRASKFASSTGERSLARGVLQKMHLEFAKNFLEQGNPTEAIIEITAGARIKNGTPAYERDIKRLQKSLF